MNIYDALLISNNSETDLVFNFPHIKLQNGKLMGNQLMTDSGKRPTPYFLIIFDL